MPEHILNLNFHGIGRPIGRDFGAGEREFWVKPETFDAALDACMGRSDVNISFDDGNWSDLDLALPALTQRGISATFFIVPGWLGEPGFMSKRDLKEVVAAGMPIGNHGLQHHDWTTLEPAKLVHEVAQGRRLLEELTGTEIKTLAIPFGAYNDMVLDALRRQGYEHVYTSDGGTAAPDAWLQPREHARASHDDRGIAALISDLLG
ncbi:MAG: polysaccharide deacetylase family protein [Solirubrobacteraceae bacterium]